MKKLLINKNKINELRIALLQNTKLINLEIDNEKNRKQKGNIYKGLISKIEPSLDAFFINFGSDKDGFLPFKEISKDYLEELNLKNGIENIPDDKIKTLIGKSIIIQIEKEERESKGASLTTYISLAGYYLVLMPYNKELSGISKKIYGNDRYKLKEKLININIPKNMGVIIRTLGLGKSINDLKWELNILLSQLKMIKNTKNKIIAPSLIYEENNTIIRVIRDYLKQDIEEILIDETKIFNSIYKYLSIINSKFINKVKLYNDIIPIFTKYKVEQQIELISKREIFLPSGGSITIDYAEALTSIDINSSKSNNCFDIEETALQTNLEAIEEILKQLRLRDLGGLIILDLIDMSETANKLLIEKKIQEEIAIDKAKIQIGKISKFGLLELSRQRIKSSHNILDQIICNKCNGSGKTNNIEIISINMLKAIEEEIVNNNTIYQICIEIPIDILSYIINIKKKNIETIEKKYQIKITILGNKNISTPNYKIYKLKNINNKKIKKKS